jgi:peptidoglycan pentaglycine glycine transferase (the first glycine)
MELVSTTDLKTFDEFAERQIFPHYSKLSFWGRFESKPKSRTEYLSFIEAGKIVATAVLIKRTTLFGKTWYIPNGPSLDYFDLETLKKVLHLIKHEAIKAKVLYIRIDTNIPRRPHNQKGDVIEGFNNEFITETFESVDFKHTGYMHGYSGYLFSRFTFVLETQSDIKALFDKAEPNIRNLYKKNLRRGVETKAGTREELGYLVEYGKQLADKYEFKPKDLSFFQKLFDLAEGHIDYRIVSAHIDQGMLNINKEKAALSDTMKQHENNPKKTAFIKEIQRQIGDLEKEEKDLSDLIKSYGNMLVLGAALYLVAGKRAYNIYTYTNKDFPSFHATISLHIDTILEMKAKGIEQYDFVGISGSVDPKDPHYGLYDFKRKFGGEFTEHLGEFYYKPRPRLAALQYMHYVYQRKFERRSYRTFVRVKASLGKIKARLLHK